MTLLIALSAWHSVRRYALLNFSSAVRAIKLSDDGDIEVETTGGKTHAAKLGVEQFVNSRLTILSYRRDDWRWTNHVVIVADMLDADLFRQLRMRLKWRR